MAPSTTTSYRWRGSDGGRQPPAPGPGSSPHPLGDLQGPRPRDDALRSAQEIGQNVGLFQPHLRPDARLDLALGKEVDLEQLKTPAVKPGFWGFHYIAANTLIGHLVS